MSEGAEQGPAEAAFLIYETAMEAGLKDAGPQHLARVHLRKELLRSLRQHDEARDTLLEAAKVAHYVLGGNRHEDQEYAIRTLEKAIKKAESGDA